MSSAKVAAVGEEIVGLLRRFGHSDRAEWIAERVALIAGLEIDEAIKNSAVRELHLVVLGMGGLMDIRLTAPSANEATLARADLDRLANQLYELTR